MNLQTIVLIAGGGYLVYRYLLPKLSSAAPGATLPGGNGGGSKSNARNYVVGSEILSTGSRGADVIALQSALSYLGYPVGAVDGIYGNKTQEAVRKFQVAAGISPDGIAGRETYGALDRKLRESGGSFILSLT